MTEPWSASALPRIAPRFRFQWEEAQQAYVILYPEGMVKLNPSAGEILKRCDGSTTVTAIIADLQRQFPGVDLHSEVHTFLEIARANGWICDQASL
jgi:pyrroloquinoline quinone biosynthesis protein D